MRPRNADSCRILKELGRGERIALSKLAVEHLERTGRPFRIAIDVAIWQFQTQAGQGGANPALRTLYYRLLKLLALPIHPIFVYDGKHKPLTKRNKTVTAYRTCLPNEMSKELLQAFRFPHHTALGEAEAECALLQRKGIVDAVMSQDVDALMFGSTMTLRDWSREGTRGNKSASHVSVFRAEETWTQTGLDSDGMILVALLGGGDYNTSGVPGVGPSLACEIARAQFGARLVELLRQGNTKGVTEWRDRLQYELETNESGYFKNRHKAVRIPEGFPDSTIAAYYTDPAVSSPEELEKLRSKCAHTWDTDVDVPALREYVAAKFEWLHRYGATKLIRTLAPSLLANCLRRGLENTTILSADSIQERRAHHLHDGLPELCLEVIPSDIVKLNLEGDEDNPRSTDQIASRNEDLVVDADEANDGDIGEAADYDTASHPWGKRKSPPWDPTIPQKIWVPQTIVKLGVGAFVEAWEQKQRNTAADPKKFVARKCPKSRANTKLKDSNMKSGALDRFLTSSKSGHTRDPQAIDTPRSTKQPDIRGDAYIGANAATRTPSKKAPGSLLDRSSPTIDRYFNRLPLAPIGGLDPRKDGIAGIQIPLRACYPALGLYGSELRSRDTNGPLVPTRIIPGNQHSNQSPADSEEVQDGLSHNQSAVCIRGKPSSRRNCKGAALTNPIVLSSSPRLATTPAPSPPGPSFVSNQLSPSVTQRSKRRSRDHPAHITESSPEARSHALAAHALVPTTKAMKSYFATKKAIVVSRKSLPGTWNEVDEEKAVLLCAGAQRRRLPRVSILDMTDD